MPITHFSISTRRTTQAQSATDVVHYLTREGAWQEKGGSTGVDRDVEYLTRQSPTTKSRNDLVASDVCHLPLWAEGSAVTFFQEAALWERTGGRYAYVIQMSLPRSLSHEQQMALKDDFIAATLHDKSLLWVKHEPMAVDGEPNPHLHIMFSARVMDDIERSPRQTFARYNRAHPEEGGCLKDRFWNEKGALRQMRMAYTDITNFHLERAGVSERLDPRNLWDQGIDRASFGKASRGQRLYRNVEDEQAKASSAWEQRKAYKDIGPIADISREEFILLVRQWTRDYQRGQELPWSSAEVVAAWQAKERQRLEAEAQRLAAAIAQGKQHADVLRRARQDRSVPIGQVMAALAASEPDHVRHGLHTHIFDKEQSYGR